MSKNTDAGLNIHAKQAQGNPEIKYNSNSKAEHITEKQLQALLISLAPSRRHNFFFDSLTTGWKKEKARKSLKEHWQIKDNISVCETLDYLTNEGERTTYNIMLPHFLCANDKKNRRVLLKRKYMAIDLLIEYSDNLSDCLKLINSGDSPISAEEKDLKRGILAWDMCLIIVIARVAFDAGYLTKGKAWKYIISAYENCRNQFSDWTEITDSILIGGGMKTGPNDWFTTTFSICEEILNDMESPWKKLNFK